MGIHSDERLKISVAQKKAIRLYNKSQVPQVGHKHIRQWFKEGYGTVLPFSTISNILSSKFDHLDQLGSNHDDAKRCRPPKYPDLEIALAECIGRMKAAGIDLTGIVLLNTAHELWPNIPAYRGLPIPALSGGWVEKFKARHRIKLRSLQVEAASTRASKTARNLGPMDLSPTGDGKLGTGVSATHHITDSPSQRTIESIRMRIMAYSQNDIFTMSETELFWRLVPNATQLQELSSQSRIDCKERITVALSCNASGSQRLPPYVVGHYSSPRSFHAPGNDIKSLNCLYSSNRLAWMTVSEWRAWIKWFDGMIDRPVLLILDPHKSHEVACTNLSDMYTLRNTEIIFLPANVSSMSSPFELGIFQNFKALYRKTLLSFISEFYQQGDLEGLLPSPVANVRSFMDFDPRGISQDVQYIDQIDDPQRAINLYTSLYWIQKAWMMDLNQSTITQAWSRSTLMGEVKDTMNDTSPTSAYPMAMILGTESPSASSDMSRSASVISQGVLREISRLTQSIRATTASLDFMGDVTEVLNAEYYIYPAEEVVLENVDDFIELSTAQFFETETDLGDDPIYVIAPVTQRDADRAVKLLLNFEEQRPDSSVRYMQFLAEYKDMISQRSSQPTTQLTSISTVVDPMTLPNSQMVPNSPSNSVGQSSMMLTSPMSQHSPYMNKFTLPQKPRTDSQGSRAGTSISTMSRSNSTSSSTSIGGPPDSLDGRLPSGISAQRNSFSFGSGAMSFPPTSNLLSGSAPSSHQTYNSTGGYYGAMGIGQYGMNQSHVPSYSSNVRGMTSTNSTNMPNNSLFTFNPYSSSQPGGALNNSNSNNSANTNGNAEPSATGVGSNPYGSNLSSGNTFSSLLSAHSTTSSSSTPTGPGSVGNPGSSSSTFPSSNNYFSIYNNANTGTSATATSGSSPGQSRSRGLEPIGTSNNGSSTQPQPQQPSQSQHQQQQVLPSTTEPPQSHSYSPTSNSSYALFNSNSAPVYYPAHAT